MKIDKIEVDWYNKLLSRRELKLIIGHESSTPKRVEVREFISKKFDTPTEKIIVEKIESIFGSRKARVHAHIYDDVEYARKFEKKNLLKKHALLTVESGESGKAS